MRTHSGKKPFECASCGKKFSRKENLRRHQALHSDERMYKCEICPDERSFKSKHYLNAHMKFHYEPRHSCTVCGKKFHRPSTLKEHMQGHFKPTHSCGGCGKMFHTSSGLNRHKKRNICWLFFIYKVFLFIFVLFKLAKNCYLIYLLTIISIFCSKSY